MIIMNDLLYFPRITVEEAPLNQSKTIESYDRQVFCEKKSITQNEFFQAGLSGIKASLVLVVYEEDYKEEAKLKYNGKVFHIYRTYERPDEKIELYCEVKAGGGN